MPIITDKEFGEITVRRSARATQVRIRASPDGRLRASLPVYAPLFLVKRLIKNSRAELRDILSQTYAEQHYEDGMQIGKSHTLLIRRKSSGEFKARLHGQRIIAEVPDSVDLDDPAVNRGIRDAVIRALRKEAKSYLPRRLAYLAEKYGYEYQRVRFSHASSRWGSCSNSGTVSLNIALMKLPFELIDYVLIHELSHTREMNHSENFWQLVAEADEKYQTHRRELKSHSTSI